MPVVDIDTDELRALTGHGEKTDEEFEADLFALGLEYEGETEDGDKQFEFAPDRLDRLSVEGVARSLRYQYGDARGVHVPDPNSPDWTIEVDPSVPDERPYVTGAVVRGVDLDEAALDSLIQLQEKLHATMGRGRAKGAIGIHDLTMLKGAGLGTAGGSLDLGGSLGAGGADTGGTDAGPVIDDDALDGSEPPESLDEGPARGSGENSITYRGVEPDGDQFVPLDADAAMTPGEVLTEHPTGETYADLVEGLERYPAIYDEIGLFSFPPVINGRRTEVSTDSRDLFIELTGTDQWTIDKMCVVLCYALSARGGAIEEIEVVYQGDTYPEEYGPELVRPDLDTDEKTVGHDRIETVLGVELDREEVVDLFERSGLDASYTLGEETTRYDVTIPPYRVDVLHPLDLIDDVGRAYGFDELEPRYPDVGTVGGRHERSRLERAVRTALVGLGFEDTLNFHMTAADENYERMQIEEGSGAFGAEEAVGITSPYSEDYTQLRTWALPSLVQVLENNTHRSYPQDLAEVGFVAHRDDDENTRVAEARRVAGVVARTDATYEDAKARLQAVCDDFDAELETPAVDHPSFIPGRAAAVELDGERVGVVGELHPAVLVDHDVEVPVAAFEFDLSGLA
ncbi:phenylalanine--tRNA ligase subunit beta [Candidatus Halobonum tyrrellensis]|uniref:Phenylalanine--tRNA ligase beta subunit n=1 Tax=Candidatus Halobonum tyrrellensis G22 TaxID=1324957 RepID=V4GS98_9EURY|nr:phenylalanine--tRNA ligase subunit beta [Candidatus Halobonum tyrrellensis]ESP87956.1 phenylalanyl-tRNA ligase subunit beta [Candidatus Halobonum tyrrellensis G22]